LLVEASVARSRLTDVGTGAATSLEKKSPRDVAEAAVALVSRPQIRKSEGT
jgi:hypothetical protein